MSSRRDQQRWLALWRNSDSQEFHKTTVNQYLSCFFSAPAPQTGNRVFVPLCGKSLDMLWLAQQGYQVIGVEISPVAIKAFFEENELKANKSNHGNFSCWTHNNISLLHGDYFALSAVDLGTIDLVYDCAALTAFDSKSRQAYVRHLLNLIPAPLDVLLLTVEDQNEYLSLDDVPLIDEELFSLYDKDFTIHLEQVDKVLEPSTSQRASQLCLYKAYRLTRKTVL